jgi:hypothetical protein
MSTYREIHGKAIKSLSTDPSDANVAGQVWYNTDSNTFKTVTMSSSIVSQPGILRGTTGSNMMGSFSGASADAMGVFGGSPPASAVTTTEELTAGVAVGGTTPPGLSDATEEYNGSAWSTANAMPEALRGIAGGGPQTAGIIFSGGNPPGTGSVKTKYYDGTNWAVQPNDMNTPRVNASGCGTQTAALAASGEPGPGAVTEEWNGSSWTTVNSLNTGRNNQGPAAMQGTTSDAAILGGNTPYPSASRAIEEWDGTSWSTNPLSLVSNGNEQAAGQGSSTSAIGIFGGSAGSTLAEQFVKSTNVITAGAFSSGGTVPQIVRGGSSGGTQTAAWITGGLQYPGDTKNKTWTYDGASWSSAEDLPANLFIGGGVGPATAGLAWDGIGSYGPGTATYEWDGTNWTAGGAAPAIGPGGNSYSTGAGVGQTAAVAMGGIGDPPPASSDRMIAYDGSSWSSDESLPSGIAGCAADGPNTAIWIAGGRNDTVPSSSTDSKEYDGSSWTTTGSLVNPIPEGISFHGWGTQTSAIVAGGNPAADTASQQYNGTIWVSAPSLSTGRDNNAYCSKTSGSQTGFIAGGYSGTANTGATEEYNAETTALNVKTLTQS